MRRRPNRRVDFWSLFINLISTSKNILKFCLLWYDCVTQSFFEEMIHNNVNNALRSHLRHAQPYVSVEVLNLAITSDLHTYNLYTHELEEV